MIKINNFNDFYKGYSFTYEKVITEKENRLFAQVSDDYNPIHFDNNVAIKAGFKIIKIPSGEVTNIPLLREIALKEIPVIISSGMSNWE